MAREQGGKADGEASLLNRREFLRATGTLAGTLGLVAVGNLAAASSTAPRIDVQTVTADQSWTGVRPSGPYTDPIVVTGPLSYRGPQPATPRLRNVTDAGFELAVQEWLYLDGAHRSEAVGCFTTDPGAYSPPDGTPFVAGTVRANAGWQSASFPSSFATTPLVFSQVQTVNGVQPVATRHRNVFRSGLEIRVQEEESQGPHRVEEIGYLAIEPGSGTLDGHPFEVNRVDVGDEWRTVTFDGTYSQPVLFADLQTSRGMNTCTLRCRNLSGSSVEIKVEEERSHDREVAHLAERVGYLVCERAESTSTTGYGANGFGDGKFGG